MSKKMFLLPSRCLSRFVVLLALSIKCVLGYEASQEHDLSQVNQEEFQFETAAENHNRATAKIQEEQLQREQIERQREEQRRTLEREHERERQRAKEAQERRERESMVNAFKKKAAGRNKEMILAALRLNAGVGTGVGTETGSGRSTSERTAENTGTRVGSMKRKANKANRNYHARNRNGVRQGRQVRRSDNDGSTAAGSLPAGPKPDDTISRQTSSEKEGLA